MKKKPIINFVQKAVKLSGPEPIRSDREAMKTCSVVKCVHFSARLWGEQTSDSMCQSSKDHLASICDGMGCNSSRGMGGLQSLKGTADVRAYFGISHITLPVEMTLCFNELSGYFGGKKTRPHPAQT